MRRHRFDQLPRTISDDKTMVWIIGLAFGIIGLSVVVALLWGLQTGVIIGQEIQSW